MTKTQRLPRNRGVLTTLAVLCLLLSVLVIAPRPAGAVDPADFNDELVISSLSRALSMDFLPDGRALIAGKEGAVYLADLAAGTRNTYLTVPNVEFDGERGLLDIYVHPNFANNGYFYVYYSQAPSTRLHVDRYTFTGNGTTDAGTRTTIWTNPGPLHSTYGKYHIGGSLNIGPDNMFYLSVGDGFQSANSQLTTNVFGKILRFDQNGNVPTDNPWYDGAGPNIDEIWAIGLRNPFRADFDDVTGRYFIGDVGGNQPAQAYEEVNIGVAGGDFGWADCEGPLGQPKNGPNCPAGVTAPIHYYAHDPDGACCQNAAITGGEVVRGSTLPADLQGAYVFADSAVQDFRFLTFNTNGSVASDGLLKDASGNRPVWLGQGPDGHIYYVHFSYTGMTSEIRRLRYTGAANQPPTITQASATPTSGSAPLAVQFTGSATDPEGDPISYLWNFGDGTTSTARNPLHTYATQGAYNASLTVTAAGQSATSSNIAINSGNAPVVTITSPTNGSSFVAGDVITVAATATDDGPLNNASYSWNVNFLHDNHEHPAATNVSGPTFNYTVPDTGHDFTGDTGYRFEVTVTDSLGLSTVRSVDVVPDKVDVLVSTTGGVSTLGVDGIARSVPFTLDTVTNFRHSLEAPDQTCAGGLATVLDNWSDGGASTHEFLVPANNTSVTANYSIPATPYTGDIACTGNPIGQIVAPANQSVHPNGPVTIDVLATDDNELASVQYLIKDENSGKFWNEGTSQFQTGTVWNNLPAPAPGTTRYEGSFEFDGAPPAGGLYRVRARPFDTAGNSLNGPIMFINITDEPAPDTTAPVISITAPGDGQVLPAAPVTLQATLTDNEEVAGALFVVVDTGTGLAYDADLDQWAPGLQFVIPPGPPQGLTSHTSSFSFDPATGSGNYFVVAVGFDAVGNVSNIDGHNFVVGVADTTAPTAVLDLPAAGSSYPGGPVQLQATISDNLAVGRSNFVIVDQTAGKTWNSDTNSWVSGLWLIPTELPPFLATESVITYSFDPSTGSGNYRALVIPYDMARNKGSIVFADFSINPPA